MNDINRTPFQNWLIDHESEIKEKYQHLVDAQLTSTYSFKGYHCQATMFSITKIRVTTYGIRIEFTDHTGWIPIYQTSHVRDPRYTQLAHNVNVNKSLLCIKPAQFQSIVWNIFPQELCTLILSYHPIVQAVEQWVTLCH